MGEQREIRCRCGKLLGKVSFEKKPTEEEWQHALSGYSCPDCYARNAAAKAAGQKDKK